MQVSIQTTSGLERKLTVGVPAERIDKEVNARLQKAAGQVRLDGFRPGKVPMKVMKQKFGASVRQEVISEVVSQSFQEAVVQEKLKPAGMPAIEPKSMDAGSDLEYVATFEVMPEIELRDCSVISIEKPVAEVGDGDIDTMIESLREQRATWSEVERPAALGDKVTIDFVGRKGGEIFEGGSAENTDLELGSGRMIPGFEDAIVGMAKGEEKVAALKFPDDYHAEELKGADVEFTISLKAVSEKTLPALDEEFFKLFGVDEGGEQKFREEVKSNMDRELANVVKSKVKAQVMDGILEVHDMIQVPRAMVAQEIESLRGQMLQQFGGAAKDLDTKSLLPDEMFSERAERRVRLGLLLSEYISANSLSADPDKVKAMIEEIASTYEKPEEVINYYYGNQEQLQQISTVVLEDTVVEKLLEVATVTDKPCSYEDAVAPTPPPGEAA